MPTTQSHRPSSLGRDWWWALVLAGGEGSRLQTLTTTPSGVAVPKQFCSLGGGCSLLHDALTRASFIVPPERTCAIVSQHHARWWQSVDYCLSPDNIIVQPRNRGTATGILFPLLQILRRDPDATLFVLPSDHYVRNEAVLSESLRHAAREVERHPDRIVLLGLSPEEADPELGYIVPTSECGSRSRAVSEFIEKPTLATARALIDRGGMWNAFIFAARGQTLLKTFERRCPEVVSSMRAIIEDGHSDADKKDHFAALYDRLPSIDFSRDILQRSLDTLRVVKVPPCGWSDLGTPRRVAETVARYGVPARSRTAVLMEDSGFLDLAAQLLPMPGARALRENAP
jgi:mannose-1-phosphate guanylyltransferase